MSVPVLICTEGPRSGHTWEITTQGLRIGRDPQNEVHLEDTGVSRAHARVLLHNGAVWVQDAGSRNGVFVNDGRVTEHKQVSPGDVLVVGTHRFSIAVQEPVAEHSVSVSLAAVSEPAPNKKGWRIWPFAVAFFLIFGCIGIIAVRAGGSGGSGGEGEAPGTYSLERAMGTPGQPDEQAEGDPGDEDDVTLRQMLAMNAGTTADGCEPPPEGLGSTGLVEEGHSHYSAGRLREAICSYNHALKLDPQCEICVVRIERLQVELKEEIDRQYAEGMRNYDSLRYDQAIAAWEMVLVLEPDEESAIHQRTEEYIQQAKEKLEAQGRY